MIDENTLRACWRDYLYPVLSTLSSLDNKLVKKVNIEIIRHLPVHSDSVILEIYLIFNDIKEIIDNSQDRENDIYEKLSKIIESINFNKEVNHE